MAGSIGVGEDRVWHFPARVGEPRVAIPISTDAERALFDVRQGYVEQTRPVDQDQRIMMIPYTQDTLCATAKRSPLDRAILARALTGIDAMGAQAIGIDILIDRLDRDDRLHPALLGRSWRRWHAIRSHPRRAPSWRGDRR